VIDDDAIYILSFSPLTIVIFYDEFPDFLLNFLNDAFYYLISVILVFLKFLEFL